MYWVYILENYLKRDFISVTIAMEARLEEHKEEMLAAGGNPETLEVVYKEYHTNAMTALAREKELKKLSSSKLHKFISKKAEEVRPTY